MRSGDGEALAVLAEAHPAGADRPPAEHALDRGGDRRRVGVQEDEVDRVGLLARRPENVRLKAGRRLERGQGRRVVCRGWRRLDGHLADERHGAGPEGGGTAEEGTCNNDESKKLSGADAVRLDQASAHVFFCCKDSCTSLKPDAT